MEAVINKIQNILENEYSNENFVTLVKEIFPEMQLVAPDKFNEEFSNFSSYVDGYIHIGNYTTPDNKKILILAIQLKNAQYVENSRSAQRNFAKRLIENNNCDASFIAFYTKPIAKRDENEKLNDKDSKWRISFVKIDFSLNFDNGKLRTNKSLTPAKRYSYLVGKGEPSHTAIERIKELIDRKNELRLIDVEDAFSVEKVTNEFFKAYTSKFNDLNEYLSNNDDFKHEALRLGLKPEEFSVQFSKKLLGQIVFLYFLQKKGWLGVNAWPSAITEKEFKHAYYDFDKVLSRKYIPRLYVKDPLEQDLYRLNTKEFKNISPNDECYLAKTVNRSAWGTGPRNFMRRYFEYAIKQEKNNFYDEYLEPLFYDALNKNRGEEGYWAYFHCRIPFLSGSLFEPINNYDWQHSKFNIPNEMFSNKITETDINGNGILDIFDRYNFTMSEDEPMEKEVAIDPEMLGKVFESMLEVKDRKAKGEFYTPREVVHYMCQDSLINYLTNKTKISYDAIRDFILYGEYIKSEDTNKRNNADLLISKEIYQEDDNGKILLSRLKEIDDLLANIKVADPAVGSGAFPLGMLNEIVKARTTITDYMYKYENAYNKRLIYTSERSIHKLKLETIKNSIFAVDLEPSAVDITKLRLWLSLVIDDEINPKAQNELEGHKNPLPLPNLECNILCGNSLIDELEGHRLIEPSAIIGIDDDISFSTATFNILLDKLLKTEDKLFSCSSTEEKISLKKEIEDIKFEIIKLQITSNGSAKEDVLDRIYQTRTMSSKPYIAWQLDFAKVFKDKKGFDIVIGNPPYVGESGHKKIFQEVAKTEFGKKFYIGKMDFWYFFVSKGLNLLNENGYLSYIAPNNWMTTFGGKKVRNDILDRATLIKFIDFKDFMVFDSAAQQTMIFLLKKEHKDNYEFEYKYLDEKYIDKPKEEVINNFFNNKIGIKYQSYISKGDNYNKAFTFNNSISNMVLNNIKRRANFYLDGQKEISNGIHPHHAEIKRKMLEEHPNDNIKVGDGIFIVSNDELKEINPTNKELELIKPYYNSENIKRYFFEKTNIKSIIYTDSRFKDIELMNDYPNLKLHLDKFKVYITSNNRPYGLHRARNQYFFEGKKIFSLRKCEEPSFTYVDVPAYVTAEYYSIKSDRIDLLYLVGILNSNVIKYWLKLKGKMQGNHYQIDAEPLKNIPICYNMEYREKLKELVIKRNNNNDKDENDFLEKMINQIVYKIYDLDENNIKIIENEIEN